MRESKPWARRGGERKTPPTSKQLDDFSAELEHAGDRRQLLNRVKSLKARLSKILTADELELVEFSGRAAKKNLAQRFDVVKPDIRDLERLQGFAPDWTKPSDSVTKRGHRWKLVGNAVTVDTAAWIGSKLAAPGFYDPTSDAPLKRTGAWPRAAWGRWPSRRVQRFRVAGAHQASPTGGFPLVSDRAAFGESDGRVP